jgi:hypothetical protein
MRVGYTVSGGVISLLEQTSVRREGNNLHFDLHDRTAVLVGDVVERRFNSLAAAIGCKPKISFADL